MSKKNKRQRELPDLDPIQSVVIDARALVSCTYQVVVNGLKAGGESSLLRIAVEKLDRATDQLDAASRQLARLRKSREGNG